MSSSCKILAAFLCLLPLAANAAEKIALAGEGYGRTEVKSIIEYVLHRELSSVDYEDQGDFLPAEEFEKYSMVILAGMPPERAYTVEESMKIYEYVENGGRLLLIHQAPKMFSIAEGRKDEDFAFGRSYYIRDTESVPENTVNRPDSPLLAGAFEAAKQPFWLRGNVMLKSMEWENLIGSEAFILVGHRDIGKGKAYYAGSELFRLLIRAKTDGSPDVEGWIQILKNMISDTEK